MNGRAVYLLLAAFCAVMAYQAWLKRPQGPTAIKSAEAGILHASPESWERVGPLGRYVDPESGVICYTHQNALSCVPPWKD